MAIIEAAVLLYHIMGNKVYLSEAKTVKKANFNHFKNKRYMVVPILRIYPGLRVLFPEHKAFYRVTVDPKYINLIIGNVDCDWYYLRNQYGLINNNWSKRISRNRKG